ncbi:hypothetical protein ACFU7Y_23435 [Kitasatospora sp. NPDC057542]|uniref:hypothetical protein n=1 Tax=Kitasatospora sp. NPDC057542 TaxID=3346162 RepID=UPI00368E43B0
MTLPSDILRGDATLRRDADAATGPPYANEVTSSAARTSDRFAERTSTASIHARKVLDRHQSEGGQCSDGCGPWPCNTVVDAVQACGGAA